MSRIELDNILLDKELDSVNKVYRIARKLRKEEMINHQLWYAILELKEEHFKEIIFEGDES